MPAKRAKPSYNGSGKLVVTAQQSRFHTEMDEDNNLKEIIVKDLSISISNRELLSHATLNLQRGRHYILHGRNGIGKSTLLRAIAEDQIPNIPRGVKVLLLGQTQSSPTLEEGLDSLDLDQVSVLDYVIRSDERREKLIREAAILEKALEASTSDSTATVTALRKVELERLKKKVEETGQIAQLRSGARGKDTRKVLITLEEELKVAEARLEGDVSVEEMSAETQRAAEILSEVQTSLELMDAAGAEAKARSVLLGLGFSRESIDQSRSQLSGGWKTRCSLACALCQSVDLLLLDEPTNFLDLPSIIWLERHIQSMQPTTTVLVVTHDRAFGDEVAEELLVLREQQLERFKGNLSTYESERLKQYKHLTKMKDALDKQKKHVKETIEGNVQAAKRAGDDKKLKQAASRKKKLDERMGMEVSAKGTRFKLNRDMAGYFLSNRSDIELPKFDPPATMNIPLQPADLRFPGALVSFENVSFSYGKKEILKDINLTIHAGDRIGLAGLNGSGKSTLVSLALGKDIGKGSAVKGTITRHTRGKIGLYSQLAAEELERISASSPQLTALSHFMQTFSLSADDEQPARAMLSGVGLPGRIASDVPISLLSGGQRVRLALAQLLHDPPHLLILDEVTTHLDTDTIQALISALRGYEGAILVVTHDRFFMKCVVEGARMRDLAVASRPEDEQEDESEESSDEEDGDGVTRTRVVYRLSKGKLIRLDRGMEQYEEIAARSATKLGQT